MFGTKWPSITSTWMRSAPPRSTAAIAVAERGEVGREDRRRDLHAHRLTSSEIGSPGAIWKPACGLWRRTMPAATPGIGRRCRRRRRGTRAAEDVRGASPLTPMRSGIT